MELRISASPYSTALLQLRTSVLPYFEFAQKSNRGGVQNLTIGTDPTYIIDKIENVKNQKRITVIFKNFTA